MTRYELSTYHILISEAKWLSDKLAIMRTKIESPRIPELTGQPGSRNAGSGSKQERLADEYLDSTPQYEERLSEVRAKIRRIETAVKALPPKERLVTTWHCLERLSYKAIAIEMGLSISSVAAIQANAYKTLEEQDD